MPAADGGHIVPPRNARMATARKPARPRGFNEVGRVIPVGRSAARGRCRRHRRRCGAFPVRRRRSRRGRPRQRQRSPILPLTIGAQLDRSCSHGSRSGTTASSRHLSTIPRQDCCRRAGRSHHGQSLEMLTELRYRSATYETFHNGQRREPGVAQKCSARRGSLVGGGCMQARATPPIHTVRIKGRSAAA